MEVRLSGIVEESIVDGPGLRYVVFAQGCRHGCEGCHNPHTHDFNGGYTLTVDQILAQVRENPLIKGITLSGGDPFEQAEAFGTLALKAKAYGYHVMTYTGYTFEKVRHQSDRNLDWKTLAEATDILVDGRFERDLCHYGLKFRGSSNQRIIDMSVSWASSEVVELIW